MYIGTKLISRSACSHGGGGTHIKISESASPLASYGPASRFVTGFHSWACDLDDPLLLVSRCFKL